MVATLDEELAQVATHEAGATGDQHAVALNARLGFDEGLQTNEPGAGCIQCASVTSGNDKLCSGSGNAINEAIYTALQNQYIEMHSPTSRKKGAEPDTTREGACLPACLRSAWLRMNKDVR